MPKRIKHEIMSKVRKWREKLSSKATSISELQILTTTGLAECGKMKSKGTLLSRVTRAYERGIGQNFESNIRDKRAETCKPWQRICQQRSTEVKQRGRRNDNIQHRAVIFSKEMRVKRSNISPQITNHLIIKHQQIKENIKRKLIKKVL